MDHNNVNMCVRLMQYAIFADRTQERRPSEVKEALRFFFTEEEIEQATAIITGRADSASTEQT